MRGVTAMGRGLIFSRHLSLFAASVLVAFGGCVEA